MAGTYNDDGFRFPGSGCPPEQFRADLMLTTIRSGASMPAHPEKDTYPMTSSAEREPTYFNHVGDFVDNYLLQMYPRLLIEASDLALLPRTYPNLCDPVWLIRAWCREWWRHTDAVVRLDALWREWELMRRSDDEYYTVSRWFVNHADVHMGALLSPFGTFAGCSTILGHNNGQTLHPDRHGTRPLPSSPIPPDLLDIFTGKHQRWRTADSAEFAPERADL